MIRLCLLTRMLDEGGAQRQLLTLAENLDPGRFDVSVITFYDGGRFAEAIRRMPRVRYIPLSKRGRWDIVRFCVALMAVLRRQRPHLLHGYLPMANCLAVLAKPFLGGGRVVLGLRASDMDASRYDWVSRWQYRLERLLGRSADGLIVNSEAGLEYAASRGFPRAKMTVIPNGIDVDCFCPNPAAGAAVRREWGVRDDEILIGLVARLDPMKDPPTFLAAAAEFARRRPQARFAVVGDGPAPYRQGLVARAEAAGILQRVIWAGFRPDMPAVYNALDVACSSSVSEGFPNAIAEAMACGVPCVVTDAGDLRRLVGDTGIVVPRRAPGRLAAGWEVCLGSGAERLRQRGRLRIAERFSVGQLIRRTSAVLTTLAATADRGPLRRASV
jgi:glycosyltransferase involved in cell wall biosynthesis